MTTLFVIHSETARADVKTVCKGGGCDYETIFHAADEAHPGDTILVKEGVYIEDYPIYPPMAVTITSEAGPEKTVIRMAAARCLFNFTGVEGTPPRVLSGFTIIAHPSSLTQRGAAIYIGNRSKPLIAGNVFSDCVASQRGGAICIEEAETQPTIANNRFINNSVRGTDAIGGGAICIKDAAPIIRDNIFDGNHSDKNGGAIYVYSEFAPLQRATILNNTFISSTAYNARGTGGNGGAIYVGKSSPWIQGNTIVSSTAYSNGGAIYALESSCLIQNNVLTGNTAAIGAGIYINDPRDAVIQNNRIEDNATQRVNDSNVGGGLAVFNATRVSVDSNVIRHNRAWSGDGVYIANAATRAVTFTNNVLSANGQREMTVKRASPRIANNTIWGDPALTNSVGIELLDYSHPAIFNNVIARQGQSIKADATSYVTVSYNDLWQNQTPPTGISVAPTNLSTDPQLVAPTTGDYHLRATSPLIDAGSNSDAPHHDIEGDLRPVDGNADGVAIVDIGADEYIPQPTETPTEAPTHTATPTMTATASPALTPIHTATPTLTQTVTQSPTPVPTDTPTATATPLCTETPAASVLRVYLPIVQAPRSTRSWSPWRNKKPVSFFLVSPASYLYGASPALLLPFPPQPFLGAPPIETVHVHHRP